MKRFLTRPVLLLALGVLLTATTIGVAQASSATVAVPAGTPWTDSGIVVNAGDTVTISASGTIFIAGSDPGKTPVGAPGCSAPSGFLVPGLDCWSLIGRIGSSTPFQVSNGVTFTATTSGSLFLGVNDDFFGDNSGAWTATVNVSTSPPLPTAPDLEPTAITFGNSTLTVGNVVHFDSGIKNLGDEDTGVFNIKWFVDGKEVGAYGSHAGIPRNTLSLDGNSFFVWTFDRPGSYFITFTVDVDNHVAESNENNNSRSVTVEIAGPPVGLEFEYPLRGGPPAPAYATYGVSNPNLAARRTCFGGQGHYLNQLTHAGEDWFRPPGTPVYPVAAGKVIRVVAGWDHGAAVIVEHQMSTQQEWGSDRVYSVYLHVKNPLPVGTVVDSNTVLAAVNKYGASNSHLHWEIRIYASMKDSPLRNSCKSAIGPSYTDTGTNPADFGYINPSGWIEAH